MRHRYQFLFFAFLLLLARLHGHAQDLENLVHEKPFTVGGSLAVSNTGFLSTANAYRDPYNYYLSGSLNFSVFGVNAPFSFSYSNQGKGYQHPFNFNQFGVSPSYRSVTVHAGYRSMTFSPYTLNGHLFLGGGVDVTPKGKLRVSAMFGRLNRAVSPDTSRTAVVPSFKRWGYGLKAGIENNADQAYVILFKAWDELHSIQQNAGDSLPAGLTPQENVVLGFVGKKSFKRISVSLDWSLSALTQDVRAARYEDQSWLETLGGLYEVRASSSKFHALKTSLQYAGSAYQVGVNYERIDPGYRTLGAYFFSNDLENITVNGAFKLGPLALQGNVGVQRNDLDNKKASQMRRLVTSLSASVGITERLSTNLSFSNFRSFTRTKPKFEYLVGTPQQMQDTLSLKYIQISQSASCAVNYRLGQGKNSISTNFNLNKSEDMQDTVTQVTTLYNATTTFNFLVGDSGTSGSAGLNLSWSDDPQGFRVAIGPVAQLSKELFSKKLRTTTSAAYNVVLTDGSPSGGVLNMRITGSYKLSDKHSFNMSLGEVLRKDKAKDVVVSELTVNLNYGYSF